MKECTTTVLGIGEAGNDYNSSHKYLLFKPLLVKWRHFANNHIVSGFADHLGVDRLGQHYAFFILQ